jgi:hypothetical protein
VGVHATEFQSPAPDRLIGDIEPALGQDFLDVSTAQGEPDVEPNGMSNDLGWEVMTAVRDGLGCMAPSYGGDSCSNFRHIFNRLDNKFPTQQNREIKSRYQGTNFHICPWNRECDHHSRLGARRWSAQACLLGRH